jgi:hypothetical protein
MRFSRLCATLAAFLLTALPAQAQRNGDLIINEFLANPNGIVSTEQPAEWFEVYNSGLRAIDLRGWAVRDSAGSGIRPLHVVAQSVVVPPCGYVVLGGSTNTAANGGAAVDYAYGGALNLANSFDGIALFSPDSTMIDNVRYGNAAVSAQEGISRELLNPALFNGNGDGSNWANASVTAVYGQGGRGTPKAQNSAYTPLTGCLGGEVSPSAASVTTAVAGYRLLSAPLSGLTVAALAELNLVQGLPDEFPEGAPNLFTGYTGAPTAAYNGYTVPSSKNAYLIKGRGFFWQMYTEGGPGPNATTGTSRRADLPLTLQTTGDLRAADVATTFYRRDRPRTADGFFLLGNPFNEAFDLSGLTASSGTLSNVFQFYDPATGYTVRTRDAALGDGSPADDAPVWQGFFAEFVTAPSFPLTFTYAAAARAGTPPRPAGQTATSRHVGLILDGVTAAGAVAHDEAASLYFAADATPGWDAYDASKLTPLDAAPALLAPVGPGADGMDRALAQRSLPSELIAPVEVPLSLTAAAGTYTVSVGTFDGVPPSWELRLTDHATGTTTALQAGASYTFETEAAVSSDRFSMTVTPGVTTATEPGLGSAYALTAVSPNPTSAATRTVLQVQQAQTVRAEVFDALGRRVQTVFAGPVAPGVSQPLEVASGSLPAGTYVLRVTGADFAATRTFSVVR